MHDIVNPRIRKPLLKVILFGMVVGAVVYYLRAYLSETLVFQILLAWVALIVVLCMAAWMLSRFRFLKIGENSIMMQTGILGTKQVRMRYERVTHSHFTQSILDRVLGVGALHMDTAGTTSVELIFDDMAKGDAMALLALIDERAGEARKWQKK